MESSSSSSKKKLHLLIRREIFFITNFTTISLIIDELDGSLKIQKISFYFIGYIRKIKRAVKENFNALSPFVFLKYFKKQPNKKKYLFSYSKVALENQKCIKFFFFPFVFQKYNFFSLSHRFTNKKTRKGYKYNLWLYSL